MVVFTKICAKVNFGHVLEPVLKHMFTFLLSILFSLCLKSIGFLFQLHLNFLFSFSFLFFNENYIVL